jgi:hypothetical protein
MMRTWKVSLLIASTVLAAWATSSEACHFRFRQACAPDPCAAAYTAPPTDCCGAGGGYGTTGGAYAAGGGYAAGGAPTAGGPYYGGGYAGYPGAYGGYDFGRPGYNPGGLGGPMSGLGVRPGLGFGGFGPGR